MNISSKTKVNSVYKLPANKNQLLKLSDITTLGSKYSQMKYGSQLAIRDFAEMVYSQYEKDFDYKNGDLYITSTLTSDIDSSSHFIARELQEIINRKRLKLNLKSCKYIELLARKKILISSDYGKVQNKKDRIQSQGNMELITYPNLKSDDLLLVINDCFVTGAQWELQEELLRSNRLTSLINYYYIIKFTESNGNFDISVEDLLNNYEVNNDLDFLNLIIKLSKDKQLTWNKRTLLRSLNLNQKHFELFIDGLRVEDLETLCNNSVLSDTHLVNNGEFANKIDYMFNVLKNKSREKDSNLRSPKDA